MSNLINITSAPADSIDSTKELQIVARWKSTEKKEVAPANRVRAVMLPATIWTEALHHDNKPLQGFMLDAVADLAKDFLSSIVEESNWMRTQVNADAFTLDNLLAWNAERAAMSGRLTSEEIKAWLKESVTVKTLATVKTPQHAARLGEIFTKLAGPNHGLQPEDAAGIMSNLWQNDDSDSTIGIKLYQRLKGIANPKKPQEVISVKDLF